MMMTHVGFRFRRKISVSSHSEYNNKKIGFKHEETLQNKKKFVEQTQLKTHIQP